MHSIYWILISVSTIGIAYLCRQASRYRNRWTSRKTQLTEDTLIHSQHHWNESVSETKYSCSVCRRLGGGILGNKIIQCTICGVCRHPECQQDRVAPCKSMIFSAPSSKFGHQWKQAIHASIPCDHCGKKCHAHDFNVLHCLWCQRNVHQKCSS